MLFSHVKWFVETQANAEPELTSNEIFFVVLFVGFGLLALYFIDQFIKKQKRVARISDKLQLLRPWLPTIVRFSLVVLLSYASIKSYVFVPNFVADNDLTELLIVLSSLAAIAFAAGIGTRYAAAGLIAIYLLAAYNYGFVELLDHLEIIGMAVFLIIEGSGKLALDNVLKANHKMPLKYRKKSIRILLVSAGLSFFILAFSEKLFAMDMAGSFLQTHDWNFLSVFGVSERNFIIFIGASELLIGLSIILGWATRLVVLLLLGLLTVTAILLGISEVVGHIFAVAVVIGAWINIDLPDMKYKLR